MLIQKSFILMALPELYLCIKCISIEYLKNGNISVVLIINYYSKGYVLKIWPIVYYIIEK